MKYKRLLLLHWDGEYAKRFAFYLEKKTRLGVYCVITSDEDECVRELKEGFDIAIIPKGQEAARMILNDSKVPVFFWSESTETKEENVLPMYRAMSSQTAQLSKWLSQTDRSEKASAGTAELIGFYSPVGGAGQSVGAILLAMILGEQAPTLLLNCERYSGIRSILPAGKDSLSELIYLARVRAVSPEKLNDLTVYFGPLAVILPAGQPDDLRQITSAEWNYLLEKIAVMGGYRYIVIDVGDGIADEYPVLELCDHIYIAQQENLIAQNKIEEWKQSKGTLYKEEIHEKCTYYSLPPRGDRGLEDYRELRHGEWGRKLEALWRER